MRRLVLVFLCLTACLSFGRAAIVHAWVPMVGNVVTADTVGHFDGDGDQSSDTVGGKHKAVLHHHARSHGQRIATLPVDPISVAALAHRARFTVTLTPLAPDAHPDATKRPPKA